LTGGFLELRHPLIKPAHRGRQLLEASHDRRDFRACGISASRSACCRCSADEDTFPLLADDQAPPPQPDKQETAPAERQLWPRRTSCCGEDRTAETEQRMNDRDSRLMGERSSAQVRIATSEDVAELRTLASSCADEARNAKDQLARLRSIHADLLAAVRAAIAAQRDGETNPWTYLEYELADHAQLPEAGQHAPQLLANAAGLTALMSASIRNGADV
jgi:hypothetical protein